MADEPIEEARKRWAAANREANAKYRALLLENEAPAGLIEEFDYLERPADRTATTPVLPRHPETAADATLCRDLATALDGLRSQFIDRAVSHAAPGIGQEAMAFLHLDEALRYEGLRAEIERLERALEEVGCPP